eukprot:5375817-Karenia_brevis.AAC.1
MSPARGPRGDGLGRKLGPGNDCVEECNDAGPRASSGPTMGLYRQCQWGEITCWRDHLLQVGESTEAPYTPHTLKRPPLVSQPPEEAKLWQTCPVASMQLLWGGAGR